MQTGAIQGHVAGVEIRLRRIMTAVYVEAVSIVNGAGKHAQKRVAEAHRRAKEQLLKDKIVSVISHLLGTVTQNLAQVNV